MTGFVCVHGHFYQPPRENPWLESIEVQDSAYPYHDWNERITAECYAPNTASRVLDSEGLVADIVNNYSRISFNFGPTLLSWMQSESPPVYQAILDADSVARERFSGHGSAIAQAYNHLIMPLADSRLKRTQVIWGIRDFEHRFQRKPEGMWLPETAVDTETLELLAEYGLRFVILAPRQAARVRKIGSDHWHDTANEAVDPRRPYLQKLPSGRDLAIFFYDGPISRDVAFNGLLNDGRRFAERLTATLDPRSPTDQLVHIATDGETYGHHHRFGDMALAAAVRHIEETGTAKLTIYAEYLDNHLPEWEVQIVENSSWSCVHGVERWRSNCGCNTGGRQGWNQEWRGPLRQAFDWLKAELDPLYEAAASEFFDDPWAARNAYVNVVLDRSPANLREFLATNAKTIPEGSGTVRAVKLLELQRHLMLMYTSCGWFFDELSGIETVQVIQYSGRAAQLAAELFERPIRDEFLSRLEKAKSNIPLQKDGSEIFVNWVEPAVVDFEALAAHFAISFLFRRNGRSADANLRSCKVQLHQRESREIGRTHLATGLMELNSCITGESGRFQFAALHIGDPNVTCGILPVSADDEHAAWAAEFLELADRGDLHALIRQFDLVFGSKQYSLRSLFRDEQRRILNMVLQSATERAEGVYQTLYEQQLPVMRFLADIGSPIPRAFRAAADYFTNAILRRALERTDAPVDYAWLRQQLDQAKRLNVNLDTTGLGRLLEQDIHAMLGDFRTGAPDVDALERLEEAVDLARNSALAVDLWDAQNIVFHMARTEFPDAVKAAEAGDREKAQWADLFKSLAAHVSVRLPTGG